MDFSWTFYSSVFLIFPLICLLVMVIMMIACRSMDFQCGHGARSDDRK